MLTVLWVSGWVLFKVEGLLSCSIDHNLMPSYYAVGEGV
jgi:hypothetical protein